EFRVQGSECRVEKSSEWRVQGASGAKRSELCTLRSALSPDLHFVPASRFHLMVVFRVLLQSSRQPRPVMSPVPNLDSFQPPKENGSRGTGTPTFTPTIPACALETTCRAIPPLSV